MKSAGGCFGVLMKPREAGYTVEALGVLQRVLTLVRSTLHARHPEVAVDGLSLDKTYAAWFAATTLDEAGKIKEFTVLARPPNAVALLKDEMMRRVPMRLAAMKAKKAMGLL